MVCGIEEEQRRKRRKIFIDGKGWSCQPGRRKRRKIFGNGKKYPLNVATL